MDKQTQKNLLELVKRNYGEIAADFDLTRKKDLWPELIKLSEMVKNGDRVLDVGCGNGRLIEAFGDKKISYLGVDNSEKLIKLATNQRLLRRSAPRNDKWVVADILELDKLPERDFDYVFCIAVLHHLPGKDLRLKALEQIKNKIKPGGKIILTVWNLWSQKKFRKLIIKYDWFKLIGKNQMA
ncbi:class I SAM-dependent methyltransferase, partial [Candidatus Falkowbacteria bacterium]|nr:class I SAM-dependent methyltransferase [Candidatus Falkowbacteria bacterium]